LAKRNSKPPQAFRRRLHTLLLWISRGAMLSLKNFSGSEKAAPSSVGAEDNSDGVDVDDGPDEDAVSAFRDPPDGCVRLRPSQFAGIPSTVFVEYPPELGIRRNDISTVEPLGVRKLGYNSYWERICIKNAHCRAGFVKSEKCWTSLWSKHQNAEQMKELNCLQKVNHFPASWCIGRKDRLTRTLNTMKRVHGANGSVFDFHPETFILPGERDGLHRLLKTEISSAISQNNSSSGRVSKTFNSSSTSMSLAGGMWIVKPCASSCGQGIKVMTGQQALALAKKKKAIVQRYLARPYLIDGRKFDLRIYVLVSGVDPLRVYIHDEGLTRISTAKYSTKNLANSFAHLTNYSINKNAPNFKAAEFNTTGASHGNADEENGDQDGPEPGSQEKDPEMEGFKWSLAAFRRWLAKREGRAVMEQTFDRIFDLCLKTMIAAESEITPHLHSAAQYRSNCFELFGCDVILDADLCPHLLEVNVSPSLMGSSPLDKKIKGMVIADTLHIVGMYPHDPALLKKYGGSGATNGGGSSKGGSGLQKTGSSKGASTALGSDAPANPFAFSSLSKLMASQDRYRRDPCPESIEIAALGDTEASWLLLLMAENELQRARSSKFHCVHPTAANASYYAGLYRSGRFSDHLLAHWVMHGGSAGRYGRLIPSKYRPLAPEQGASAGSPTKPQAARSTIAVPSSAEHRPRARSAGRASTATRTSTYVPAAMLVDGAARMKLESPQQADSAARRSVSVSPRGVPRAASQQVTADATADNAVRKSRTALRQADDGGSPHLRGHSEPRHLTQPPTGFSSPPASSQLPAAPTSAMRARLALGISQAAAYYGEVSSGANTPSPQRRTAASLAREGHEYGDAVGMESVDVSTPTFTARDLVATRAASPDMTYVQYMAAAVGSAGSAELTKRMLDRAVRTQISITQPENRQLSATTGTTAVVGGATITGQTAPGSPYILSLTPPTFLSLNGAGRPPSAGRPLTAGNSRKSLNVERGLAVTGLGDSKQLLQSDSRTSLSPIKRTGSNLSSYTATTGSDSPVPTPTSGSSQKQQTRTSREACVQRQPSAGAGSAHVTTAAGGSPLKQRRVSNGGSAGALLSQVQRTLQGSPALK
jgi:hypothetical protein